MGERFLMGRSTDILKIEAGPGVTFSRDGDTLILSAAGGGGVITITGPSGFPGLDGDDGADGVPGRQGLTGLRGLPGVGIPGLDGEVGDTGVPGRRGVDGADGAAGAAGLRGVGFPGLDGEDGFDGVPGKRGVAGVVGATGPAGAKGIRGAPGVDGADGGDECSWVPPRPVSNSNPKQFRSMAHNTAVHAIPNNSLTTIPFDGVQDYDVGGVHSIAVNPERFYIPAGGAGMWLFVVSIRVHVPAGAMTHFQLRLYKASGGTNILYYTDQDDFGAPLWGTGVYPVFHATCLDNAIDSDYYYVQMYTFTADASATETHTNLCFFQCVKLN